MLDHGHLVLAGITFVASVITGALAYGFSSTTVPVALLFYNQKVLNPGLVIAEGVANFYTLIINWRGVPLVIWRVLPIIISIVPSIFIGSYILSMIYPPYLKAGTYILFLPLIYMQVAGIRIQLSNKVLINIQLAGVAILVRSEGVLGFLLGILLGLLYAATTISGPPVALWLNNLGLKPMEFRAALGIIRVVETVATILAYIWVGGFFTAESCGLVWWILPSVVIGLPLGKWGIRRIKPEDFRRICMSFDAWIVAFGLSQVLIAPLAILSPRDAYSLMFVAIALDIVLLVRYFWSRIVPLIRNVRT